MRVEILPSAMQDLADAHGFYERQRIGLGRQFLETLLQRIDSLQVMGGVHSIHFARFHRLLAKRFPYAVYYTVAEQTVYVHAVLDCRRDPQEIRDRLK